MSQTLEIIFDEKYYDLIPRPTRDEWRALYHSIQINGLQEPIVINETGTILDGYTRYEICQALGLDTPYRIQKFETKDEELRYVLEVNATRRQLNAFQRVELFYDIFESYREEAVDNHTNSNCEKKYPTGGSLVRYSELVGVGQKRCHYAIKIIESDDEILKLQCREDKITVFAAHKLLTNPEISITKSVGPNTYPSCIKLLDFFKGQPIYDQLQSILNIYQESKS